MIITRKSEPKINVMKRIILTIVIALLGTVLFAQNKIDTAEIRPKNNINLSLLVDASIISLNYERLFLITPGFFTTGKVGLGYNEEFKLCPGTCSPPNKYITIPHHITGNLGKGRHFFEFGLGGTIIIGITNQHYLLYPIIGYRIQPLNSDKAYFRIFGSIFINEAEDILYVPVGISIGGSF